MLTTNFSSICNDPSLLDTLTVMAGSAELYDFENSTIHSVQSVACEREFGRNIAILRILEPFHFDEKRRPVELLDNAGQIENFNNSEIVSWIWQYYRDHVGSNYTYVITHQELIKIDVKNVEENCANALRQIYSLNIATSEQFQCVSMENNYAFFAYKGAPNIVDNKQGGVLAADVRHLHLYPIKYVNKGFIEKFLSSL